MKVILYPKNEELRTSLPLTLEIQETIHRPEVFIKSIGKVDVQKNKTGGYKSEFYFTLPAKYYVEVRADNKREILELDVSQHEFLDFKNEFGFFFILFLIVMLGVVLWTRKIMKSQTKRT